MLSTDGFAALVEQRHRGARNASHSNLGFLDKLQANGGMIEPGKIERERIIAKALDQASKALAASCGLNP